MHVANLAAHRLIYRVRLAPQADLFTKHALIARTNKNIIRSIDQTFVFDCQDTKGIGTRRSLFLKLTPKTQGEKPRVKLLANRNAGQREVIAHIFSPQKALDKPMHRNTLVLTAEESFHIMDFKTELLLSKDEMLAAVQGASWKKAVETLLSTKKQFLEDTTNKQILRNRWNLEE